MQAAHGQEFVVAASHLILRRRHPSHARMTALGLVAMELGGGSASGLTFQPFVPVVFVHKNVV